jgi:hypothetical protein
MARFGYTSVIIHLLRSGRQGDEADNSGDEGGDLLGGRRRYGAAAGTARRAARPEGAGADPLPERLCGHKRPDACPQGAGLVR